MARDRKIAIDGETAAGKTVAGRELARRLGCLFLDTGIMYRAITWLALKRGVAMDDAAGLAELARSAVLQPLEGRREELLDTIALDGRELGPELRTVAIDRKVSLVARSPGVRRELAHQQRRIAAAAGNAVMVGRDIGTVVLPDADLKVFITASPETRARRRYADRLAQGQAAAPGQVLDEILTRDRLDSQRADSPLTCAADALVVNTDNLTVSQVVDIIEKRFHAIAGAADQ